MTKDWSINYNSSNYDSMEKGIVTKWFLVSKLKDIKQCVNPTNYQLIRQILSRIFHLFPTPVQNIIRKIVRG